MLLYVEDENLLMNQSAYNSLLNELKDHVESPPGDDPVLSHFYGALSDLFNEGSAFVELVQRVKKNRTNLTDKHLINLLFRAYQYVKFEQQDLSYRYFNSKDQFQLELIQIIKNRKTKKVFEKILTKRSTTTTIYQRYIGPFIILAETFDKMPISIADFGCGGNYGLRGIELKIPFKPITDQTPGRLITKLLSKDISFEKGLAIDKENPDSKRVKKWRMACNFYPVELDSLEEIAIFEDKIKQSLKVRFIKADLLEFLRPSAKIKFDAIILSMILYQLTENEQTKILENVRSFLKPGGIIIVQDFAAKNQDNPFLLIYNQSWFGKEFCFRTFITSPENKWRFLEILQWDNGRCMNVRPGEDFDYLFKAKN